MRKIIAIAVVALGLAACAQDSAGNYSLHVTIDDALDVDTKPTQSIATVLPVGNPAMGVSQVAVYGGQVFVATGGFQGHPDWRPHDVVGVANVAEGGTSELRLTRSDKRTAPAILYVTRLQGIIYVTDYVPTAGVAPTWKAKTFPGEGRYPLAFPGRVEGAEIHINQLQ